MPGYDFENGVKAWTKSAFGVFVGFTFFYVFNSGFLAILAGAFFFFVPLTNRNAENIINRSLFGGLMLVLLFWAFGPFGTTGLGLDLGITGTLPYLGIGLFFAAAACIGASFWKKNSALGLAGIILLGISFWMMEPWKWNNTAIIFTGVWLVGLVAGVAGDIESRTTTGVIIVVIAFTLYTIGPGSQDVGVAFFGDWWPSVYNSVSTLTGPIGNVWSQFSKTFGDAFQLLTCPVCYATQLMNGSYAPNPVGQTGAYGVELTSFDVTPILIEQPYMITVNIKNNGGADAEKVSITLTSGSDAPMPSLSTSSKRVTVSALGIDSTNCKNDNKEYACTYYFDGNENNKFIRQNIWQTVFTSTKGITCEVSGTYQIRKKYLPVNITLKYDYKTDSALGTQTDKLTFISKNEWDRLAKLDKIESKEIKSEYSSGPVMFPIGTAGLTSPIKEDQDFHISLKLVSAHKGGRIESVKYVQLNYPEDFDIKTCTEGADYKTTKGLVKWENVKGYGDKYFYCYFNKMEGKLGGSPTKSYMVTAKAEYTYSVSRDKIMKVEFGSWCCTQETDSCAKGYECCAEDAALKKGKGTCMPKCEYSAAETSTSSS